MIPPVRNNRLSKKHSAAPAVMKKSARVRDRKTSLAAVPIKSSSTERRESYGGKFFS